MGRGRFCGVGFVGKKKGRLSRKDELWVVELLLRVLFLLFCYFIVFVCEGVCMGDKPLPSFNSIVVFYVQRVSVFCE